MKSLRRQRHSRTTAHTLQLEPARASSEATGRDLQIGSCSCGQMTPTPAWAAEEIQQVFQIHLQLQEAAAELERVRAERGERR